MSASPLVGDLAKRFERFKRFKIGAQQTPMIRVVVMTFVAALLWGCPENGDKAPAARARAAHQQGRPVAKHGRAPEQDEQFFVFEKGRLPRSVPRRLTAAERAPWDRALADPKNRGKLHALFRPAISSAAFIKTIGLKPGEVIADIGCGTGALQIGMLEHGASFAKMYAVDQQEGALEMLNQLLRSTKYDGWQKIKTHVPGRDITRLPPGTLHKALIINVMQFIFDERSQGIARERQSILRFLRSLKQALRPGGLVYNYKELGSRDEARRKKPQPGKAQIEHWFRRIAHPLEATGYQVLRRETHEIQGIRYLLVVARVKAVK